MDQGGTPDAWDQGFEANSEEKGVNEVTKDMGGLNVNATPFVPGQNVFAREFVPSMPVASDSNGTYRLNNC